MKEVEDPHSKEFEIPNIFIHETSVSAFVIIQGIKLIQKLLTIYMYFQRLAFVKKLHILTGQY